MSQLDSLDRKILFELDRDSRQSFAALSKTVRIPQETARFRVRRLSERGIVCQFATVVNTERLGQTLFKILLKLRSAREDDIREMVEFLHETPLVAWVVRLEGNYDLGFAVKAEQVRTVSKLLDEFTKSLSSVLTPSSFKR